MDHTIALIRKSHAGDKEAREQLVEENVGLIWCVVRRFRERCWWRWAYLFGGGYVLLDLFAIAAELPFWHRLLAAMFDTAAWYWNGLWGAFAVLGAACLLFGTSLLRRRRRV